MSWFFALLSLLTCGLSANDEVDRQQLVHLIEAAQRANFQDVTFDYEGVEVITGPDGLAKIHMNYSGTCRRRQDGASLVDIYSSLQPDGKPDHDILGILKGTTESSTHRADEKSSEISIKEQEPLEYAGHGNFREVWLADYVKKLADSLYRYEYEGVHLLEGRECLVARFRLVIDDSTPKNKTISYVFWIDLNRGGHVVRFEQRHSGENLAGVTEVKLDQFKRPNGSMAWLPVEGKVDLRADYKDDKWIFLKDPDQYATYNLLPLTLRFDQGLGDDAFSVKAKPGDIVSDEVRKARYEFGQYMLKPQAAVAIPTDTEMKIELDRMLKDSAVMANELKASSPLRDGSGLLSYWPWAIALLSSIGIGFVLYKNRNPGRR